jgi:hypothetical protein
VKKMSRGSVPCRAVVSLLLLAMACAAGSAHAGESAPAAAQRAAELKKKGDVAMDSLRYEDAIAAYTEALSINPDPALLYNRGRVYQARSEYPEALADVERFDREASADLRSRVPKLAELLAELRGKVATLSISCNVSDARVLVRDRPVGVTPIAQHLKVNAGPGVLEVIKDGYLPFRQEMNLPGGTEIVTNVVLVSQAKGGVLAVRASAAGTVFVDGRPIGSAPVETTLDAGSHSILVRSSEYEDAQTTAVVVAGERKEVTVSLEKRPSIFGRWWFWTAAGVVVAGGAAVAVALLSEKSPPDGDRFTPAQVRGPLTVASW